MPFSFTYDVKVRTIDPLGQPRSHGLVGSDHHHFHTAPTFQYRAKRNNFQLKIVIATGWYAGLAEWIIYDSSPVLWPFIIF